MLGVISHGPDDSDVNKNSVQRLNKGFHINHKETYEYLEERE